MIKMKTHNAAIYLLSSRTRLLYKCLDNLFKNWNNKYQYPVYIHYFDNIYSDSFIKKIKDKISKEIHFIKINYKIPDNLKESELFYNRKYNRYVREQFPKKRLGYLHMERFVTNITSFGQIGCLSQDLEKYDYLMRIDDDSNFKKLINYDLFDVMSKCNFATGYIWNNVSWREISTREGLWDFYKTYINKYKVKPINPILMKSIIDNNEKNMHSLEWSAGNLNLYNMRYFKKSKEWKQYLDELNKFCGDYKYRWGDIETIGLFAYTFLTEPLIDLKLKDKNLYNNKFDSIFSSTAPSVKSYINIHKLPFLKYYHYLKKIIKK
jgi:hypothetical protein